MSRFLFNGINSYLNLVGSYTVLVLLLESNRSRLVLLP